MKKVRKEKKIQLKQIFTRVLDTERSPSVTVKSTYSFFLLLLLLSFFLSLLNSLNSERKTSSLKLRFSFENIGDFFSNLPRESLVFNLCLLFQNIMFQIFKDWFI